VVPKEGSVIWVDNMAIPKDAPNRYTAEIFMNYLLRPDIGAQLTNYTFYASPNAAARPLIDPEITGNPSIFPPAAVMDALEFIRDVGEATPQIEKMWTEIKSQ
jgi:spermidine/putrescine transport system substrate-binding protein